MDNFANDNGDQFDDFQDLLDSLDGLSIPNGTGKRGGRKGNNIGADILGPTMLKDLLANHHVNLGNRAERKINYLYGVIDSASCTTAKNKSMGIPPSTPNGQYRQTGIQAISIAQTTEKVLYLQQWRGNVINGVLSFQRVKSPYELMTNPKDINKDTGKPITSFYKRVGKELIAFDFDSIVVFEDYLNAIIEVTELPVSFPNEEVSKLQGLSEILANVNLSNVVVSEDNSDEFDDSEEELEEDEVEE
jgi:hypothetical protein